MKEYSRWLIDSATSTATERLSYFSRILSDIDSVPDLDQLSQTVSEVSVTVASLWANPNFDRNLAFLLLVQIRSVMERLIEQESFVYIKPLYELSHNEGLLSEFILEIGTTIQTLELRLATAQYCGKLPEALGLATRIIERTNRSDKAVIVFNIICQISELSVRMGQLAFEVLYEEAVRLAKEAKNKFDTYAVNQQIDAILKNFRDQFSDSDSLIHH